MKFIATLTPMESPYNRHNCMTLKDTTGDFHFVVKFELRGHAGRITEQEETQINAMHDWCVQVFGDENAALWVASSLWVFLRDETSLIRFKLRWC